MNISRWSRSASDGASGSRSRSRRAGKYLEGEAAGVGEVPDTGHAEVGEVGGGGGSLQVQYTVLYSTLPSGSTVLCLHVPEYITLLYLEVTARHRRLLNVEERGAAAVGARGALQGRVGGGVVRHLQGGEGGD